MLSLCLSTSAFPCASSTSSCEEYSSSRTTSAPLPIGSHLEENCMQRSSPLSSSAESLCSVRSSCSTRSAAEREAERRERKRLLDLSISKIQGPNQPLRRHLLVYNTVKAIQKDLDCLDEEELYVNLMEPVVDAAMEVDHWLVISEQALSKPLEAMEDLEEEHHQEVPQGVAQASAEEEAMLMDTEWSWKNEDDDNKDAVARYSNHQESNRWSSISAWAASCGAVRGNSTSCGGSSSGWASYGWNAPSSWALPTSSLLPSSLRDDTWAAVQEDGLEGWEAFACPPLSARDLLHLLPMQA